MSGIPADPGLCATCIHHRVIRSGKGSIFWLCQLSRTDPAFPRYPRLPVLSCAGYHPGDPAERADSTLEPEG